MSIVASRDRYCAYYSHDARSGACILALRKTQLVRICMTALQNRKSMLMLLLFLLALPWERLPQAEGGGIVPSCTSELRGSCDRVWESCEQEHPERGLQRLVSCQYREFSNDAGDLQLIVGRQGCFAWQVPQPRRESLHMYCTVLYCTVCRRCKLCRRDPISQSLQSL